MKRLICPALIGLALAGCSQERRENKDIASSDVTADSLQAATNLAAKQAAAAKHQQQLARTTAPRSTPSSGPGQPT